jgi:hypothetical protein
LDEREGIGQTHLLMLGEHDKQKIEGRKGRGVGKGGTVEGNTFLIVSEEIGRYGGSVAPALTWSCVCFDTLHIAPTLATFCAGERVCSFGATLHSNGEGGCGRVWDGVGVGGMCRLLECMLGELPSAGGTGVQGFGVENAAIRGVFFCADSNLVTGCLGRILIRFVKSRADQIEHRSQ